MITMFDPDDPRRARSPAELKAEREARDYDLCVSVKCRITFVLIAHAVSARAAVRAAAPAHRAIA